MNKFTAMKQSKRKMHSAVWKAALGLIIFIVQIFLVSCWPARVSLPPLPEKIERIEGYASIKITGEKGSTRSKVSFLLQLPHKGRIEIFGFLGKTICQIYIVDESSLFVIPSKKVYWQGDEEEVIYKFLGFRLNLYEMISLLSGKWEGEDGRDLWDLERDGENRIIAGQREDLRFEVREFFLNAPIARQLVFEHPLNSGRLNILDMVFNRIIKKGAFSLAFLKKYEQKSWAEIEKILSDED